MGAAVPAEEIIGVRFTRLVPRAQVWRPRLQYECVCDCGRIAFADSGNLRSGNKKSCGCLRVEYKKSSKPHIRRHPGYKHHGFGTLTYRSWSSMKGRCQNPNATKYHIYGGRGIKVCDRWMDFAAFLNDMGERPSKAHSIDRIDRNGNYEPGNCRWATPHEQAANLPSTVHVRYRGQRLTLSSAIALSGNSISKGAVRERLKKGWSVKAALETPAIKGRPR